MGHELLIFMFCIVRWRTNQINNRENAFSLLDISEECLADTLEQLTEILNEYEIPGQISNEDS